MTQLFSINTPPEMEADGTVANGVRATVLQTTLDEISTRQDQGSAPDDLCCVICLEVVSGGCIAQPCAHRNFDFVCLANWLEQRPNCPLCNAGIEEVRYDFTVAGKSWKTYKAPRPPTGTESTDSLSRYSTPRPPRPRRRREAPPTRDVSAQQALSRRRHVYRHNLYSLHIGSSRFTGYQDLSPRLFEERPDLVSRARAWIRRELQVFEFLSPMESSNDAVTRRRASNAEFLLEYIIAILKTGMQL